MLISRIMDEDNASCRHALETDGELKELEEIYYTIMSRCSKETAFEMERAVNAYIERAISISYLQGIKDFANLYITLKEDVHEILHKCDTIESKENEFLQN